MNEDKRKYPRLNISMLIEYGSKEAFLKDYALNISGGGLFITTTNTFPLGTELLLRFSLPGIDKMFEIKGEVVWVRNYSDGDNKLPGMGIKFKDIDKETQEFIIKYVNNKIK
jgi:uncharacterized protein (TIGR02266 family)